MTQDFTCHYQRILVIYYSSRIVNCSITHFSWGNRISILPFYDRSGIVRIGVASYAKVCENTETVGITFQFLLPVVWSSASTVSSIGKLGDVAFLIFGVLFADTVAEDNIKFHLNLKHNIINVQRNCLNMFVSTAVPVVRENFFFNELDMLLQVMQINRLQSYCLLHLRVPLSLADYMLYHFNSFIRIDNLNIDTCVQMLIGILNFNHLQREEIWKY